MTNVVKSVSINGQVVPFGGGGAEVSAEDVSYDNTESGLNATNVQEAVDEIAQGGTTYTAGDGIDITNNVISADMTTAVYDNTTSGLTATNVQDAIDEVNGDIDNLKNSTVINTPDTTAPTLSGLTYTLNADGIYLIEIENAHSLSTDVVLNINGETIATVSGSNATLRRLSMTLFDGKTGDTISVNITPVVSSHGYFTVQKINRIYSLVNNYN